MTAQIISLHRARIEGTTIVHRGLRHRLTVHAAREIAEELQWLLSIPGTTAMHGWLITATKDRVTLSGWDIGPIVLTREEAAEMGVALARAAAMVKG